MKNGLLGSSTLMSDVERMKKAREQQSMVGRLKKEYIRELDNYKADLFKKDNIYIVRIFTLNFFWPKFQFLNLEPRVPM